MKNVFSIALVALALAAITLTTSFACCDESGNCPVSGKDKQGQTEGSQS